MTVLSRIDVRHALRGVVLLMAAALVTVLAPVGVSADSASAGPAAAAQVPDRDVSGFEFEVSPAALGERLTLPVAGRGVQARVWLPDPDGVEREFAVERYSMMEPGLARVHPEIGTWRGHSVADPAVSVHLDVSPAGVHASVRPVDGVGSWYVDPIRPQGAGDSHRSVFVADLPADEQDVLSEAGLDAGIPAGLLADNRRNENGAPAASTVDSFAHRVDVGDPVKARSYRFAYVTDPSFAAFYGTGNVLAAKVALVNRVNQIFNADLAVTLSLVDGTDLLNLDSTAKATGLGGPCGPSACFTPEEIGTCAGETVGRAVFVLGMIIGADGYEVGHVGLGVGGGGLAGLGVVGGELKGVGCTGLERPVGDGYAIDYLAHELGHQFGGNHTFDGTQGSCGGNRVGDAAVEPGSGSSVMAYAGICGTDDLQAHTDPYLSQFSIKEMGNHISGGPWWQLDEEQTIALTGFDTNGDTIELTYPGSSPVALVRGGNYSPAGIATAAQQLTGHRPDVYGYDAGFDRGGTPGDDGFSIRFTDGGRGVNMARVQVRPITAGVAGRTGVLVDGGPGTNQGHQVTTIANLAPTVTAPADRTIPTRTPFTLTGTGSDDSANLTYLWEQNNPGNQVSESGTDLISNTKPDGPLFRVFAGAAVIPGGGSEQTPSPGSNATGPDPARTFPDLEQILAGNTNAATGTCPPPAEGQQVSDRARDCFSEFLPTADYRSGPSARQLRLVLTARDSDFRGGGLGIDETVLTIDPSAGPLLVRSLATGGTTLTGGSTSAISWTVNHTDRTALAPQVRILLSTDGGRTYPHALTDSTPNDGSALVTWPNLTAEAARIKIEAVGNYFFAVNDADFALTAVAIPPATTRTSLVATKTRRTYGTADLVELAATVTTTGPSDLAGTVVFSDGDTTVATLPAGPGGITTYTLPSATTVGLHRYTATFQPQDPDIQNASTSTPIDVEVVAATSTTRTTSNRTSQPYGTTTPALLTATVTLNNGQSPAGTVTFRDGSKTLGAAPIRAGKATFRVPGAMTVGAHRITATFAAAAPDEVTGSTSTAITVTVAKATSTVSMTTSATTQKLGTTRPILLTAIVTVTPGPEAGTITFRDGTKGLRAVKLVNGKASYRISGRTTPGVHQFNAVYRPTTPTTVTGSTSRTVRVTVAK